MKKFYQILIIILCCIYNSLGITATLPDYIITIHSEIRPELQGTALNLCRVPKSLSTNIDLLSPKGGFRTYTDLIYHLGSDTDIGGAIDILIDNFIQSKCKSIESDDNLIISSALINIATTKGDAIARKLIKTYTTQKGHSQIYPIQLFSIVNDHGTDITETLAGKLTPIVLATKVHAFREEITPVISPTIGEIIEKPSSSTPILSYQSSITKLINEIIKNKKLIFSNITYTKINYYLDFILQYVNKTIVEKADKVLRIGEANILSAPMTLQDATPFLVFQVSYSPEDINTVLTLKNKIEELQKSLNHLLLYPLPLLKNDTHKYNFLGYIQLLKLFILDPYR